jgi:hypothetical protein
MGWQIGVSADNCHYTVEECRDIAAFSDGRRPVREQDCQSV